MPQPPRRHPRIITVSKQPAFSAGTLLARKYRLERLLGKGGMGEVYLAENLDLGRHVAIKVLSPDLAANEDLLLRFRQEARSAAAIGHPGIVDVFDLGQTDEGAVFIVMECLVGENLGDCLEREHTLHVTEALSIVGTILDALGQAHAKGIIHRDLKPENLFLVTEPVRTVKILDFGISKLVHQSQEMIHTATGAIIGTPLYMPPEQAQGQREIGPPTDLYALGAVLYRMLAGRPPFTGQTYSEVLLKVVGEIPEPLQSLRPEIPKPVAELVASLLAKAPADRPQSAQEARAAIGRFMRSVRRRGTGPAPTGTLLYDGKRRTGPSSEITLSHQRDPEGGADIPSHEEAPQLASAYGALDRPQPVGSFPPPTRDDDRQSAVGSAAKAAHAREPGVLSTIDAADARAAEGANAAPARGAPERHPAAPQKEAFDTGNSSRRRGSQAPFLGALLGLGAIVTLAVALWIWPETQKPPTLEDPPASPSRVSTRPAETALPPAAKEASVAVMGSTTRPAPKEAGGATTAQATYTTTLIAYPRAARWLLDGVPLGCNPCTLHRPPKTRHVARASLAGYHPATVRVRFDREERRVVRRLERRPAPREGRSPSRRSPRKRPGFFDQVPDNPLR